MNKKNEHLILKVEKDSIAEEMGIEAGDLLLAINNEEMKDIFDYRYLIKDEYIEVLIQKKDGEQWILEIDKDYDEDLGLEFENGLMSQYLSCQNKCIFCFIDQMPKGMRKDLYFKDDDSRLSFLQGNYITLTNMTEQDVERIIKMQLSPINISVQTTNPALRCKMLNNRFAGDKLKLLDMLYEGHVEMNGQIVLCKGVNDKEELKKSIEDLSKYLPFMKSVSVVPAGITKYREGLYPIELFTKEEAGEVIDLIESYQNGFFEQYGLHFIHASDEFYMLAGRELPKEDRYDGYLQLENGVGMMRLLKEEFDEAFEKLQNRTEFKKLQKEFKRKVTIATGKLMQPIISEMTRRLEAQVEGLCVNVYAIENDYFGSTITVSGLVCGVDLISQLKVKQAEGVDLGDRVLIPSNMVRVEEGIFLDDVTIKDVETALKLSVSPVETSGMDLLDALLDKEYEMKRNNENFVYLKAFS